MQRTSNRALTFQNISASAAVYNLLREGPRTLQRTLGLQSRQEERGRQREGGRDGGGEGGGNVEERRRKVLDEGGVGALVGVLREQYHDAGYPKP
jgi:hypothetical protein